MPRLRIPLLLAAATTTTWTTLIHATPLHLRPRQDDAATAATSASAGATVSPSISITATLYQREGGDYTSQPATSAPTSGCEARDQPWETISSEYTMLNLADTTSVSTMVFTLTPDIYCTCFGGLMAGPQSSFNPGGTKFVFCETETGISNVASIAVSTIEPTASAKPGEPDNSDWANVKCDAGVLSNESGNKSPAVMWNDTGAEAAWDAMYTSWLVDSGDTLETPTYYGFSSYLTNFFHGPTNLNCETVGGATCSGGISCGQNDAPNAAVSSPAGYMILSSMIGLHQIFESINTGIGDAVGWVSDAKLTATFSPVTEDNEKMQEQKEALSIALLVLGVVAVGTFEAALPALLVRIGASAAAMAIKTNIGVQLYLGMGASMGIAKDQIQTTDTNTVEGEVGGYVTALAKLLQGSVGNVTEAVYSDPDTLYGMIEGGAFFAGDFDRRDGEQELELQSSFDVANMVERMLYAALIPMTWTTGSQARANWIATGSGVEGDEGVSGCEGYDPYQVNGLAAAPGFMPGVDKYYVLPPTDDDGRNFYQKAFFCIDDKPYWLFTSHINGLQTLSIDIPTGLDQLDGEKWGGVTAEDFVRTAVTSWRNNDWENTYELPDPADVDLIRTWTSGDISEIPGLVQIPVCTFQQAADTAAADKDGVGGDNPYWPCPPEGVTG